MRKNADGIWLQTAAVGLASFVSGWCFRAGVPPSKTLDVIELAALGVACVLFGLGTLMRNPR